MPLAARSVADFFREFMTHLESLGIQVTINTRLLEVTMASPSRTTMCCGIRSDIREPLVAHSVRRHPSARAIPHACSTWLGRAGVPRRERGRRTNAAVRVLPSLIAGQPTQLEDSPDSPPVRLDPPATVPPILVGGVSEAAVIRTVDYADGWFLLPALPPQVARAKQRLAEVAAQRRRPTPAVNASIMIALEGDPSLPDEYELRHRLSDPDGMFGIPSDLIPTMVLRGGPVQVANQLAAYAEAGAMRVVTSVAAGDWFRQTELLAEAVSIANRG